MYDLANTMFALGVSGLYFAEWFTGPRRGSDLQLAIAIDVAMVVVIVLGPWVGARSDHRGRRRPYLVASTLLAVSATVMLGRGGIVVALGCYVVAVVGFNLGALVYDTLLAEVSTPQNRGRISGIGVGVGYVGSFLAVLIGELLLPDHGYPVVFGALGIGFLLFAVPAFLLIPEQPHQQPTHPPPRLADVGHQLRRSWERARRTPGVARFLVGRFLYADAINTLIGGYLVIYVEKDVGFSAEQVRPLLGVGILASVLGGFLGGMLTQRVGPRRALHAALGLWIVAWVFGIVAGAAHIRSMAIGLLVLGGFALGATWSADRTYMLALSPPDRLGEFYGLYNTVGRFATLLGPLLWGFIVSVLGLARSWAMAALLCFLVAGRLVLNGVAVPEGAER